MAVPTLSGLHPQLLCVSRYRDESGGEIDASTIPFISQLLKGKRKIELKRIETVDKGRAEVDCNRDGVHCFSGCFKEKKNKLINKCMPPDSVQTKSNSIADQKENLFLYRILCVVVVVVQVKNNSSAYPFFFLFSYVVIVPLVPPIAFAQSNKSERGCFFILFASILLLNRPTSSGNKTTQNDRFNRQVIAMSGATYPPTGRYSLSRSYHFLFVSCYYYLN